MSQLLRSVPPFFINSSGKRAQIGSIAELQAVFPELKWRGGSTKEEGGVWAFAILGGTKETGEIHVLFAIERGSAPEHEHIDGGPYLEFIALHGGEMNDKDDMGTPVTLWAGDCLIHKDGQGRTHAPSTPTFCWGYYHQPRGMRLTGK